jgi:hypothetical protein
MIAVFNTMLLPRWTSTSSNNSNNKQRQGSKLRQHSRKLLQ